MRAEGAPRLFSRGDLSAFWALFADNLANLILIMVVCRSVFGMPAEIVYGRILPGLGVALVFGLSVYAALAYRLARAEGRSDVTALPYGVSTPIMFVYLFGVIGPVYGASGDPLLAWRVGLAAACLGGLIEMAGSVAGPWLKRHLPRAGMLGTLAGVALVFIAAVPLAEVFEHPAIGLPATVVVLVGLVALVRLPGGVPAGLAAIVLGVIMGLLTGETRPSLDHVALYPPMPVLGDLVSGFRALLEQPWIVAIVIPAEIYNFIETMNNVESAEAAGDRYPVGRCQIVDGLGTIVGSLFGSAFPTTVYVGHPGYKRMGGRAGYALGVGVVLFLASMLGGLAFLHTLVPVAAVAPLLVFVGLVITAQAFQASPARHGMAVALAMLPHVSSLLIVKWGALLTSTGSLVSQSLPDLGSPELTKAMLDQGAHVAGHSSLAAGSILVGMLWGSAAAFIIDRSWLRGAVVLGACGVLSALGVIHAPSLGFYPGALAWTYLALAAALVAAEVAGLGGGRAEAG